MSLQRVHQCPEFAKRAQLLHCSSDLLKTQCSTFIWQHLSPRICDRFQFSYIFFGEGGTGSFKKVGPKKLVTDLQSKRNGRLLNWFQPRKDSETLVILMSMHCIFVPSGVGKWISDFPLSNLSYVVWYYLLFCVKMIGKVKWKFP